MAGVFLEGVTDLFGDPVPASRGKRGRPPHLPTAENRRFVQLSLACGYDEETIAAAMSITTKTLNRHYFHELSGKRSARMRLEMQTMAALVKARDEGKVAAMSLLDKKIERLKVQETAEKYVQRAPSKSAPVGKKEAAKAAAQDVRGKYAPPPSPPALLN